MAPTFHSSGDVQATNAVPARWDYAIAVPTWMSTPNLPAGTKGGILSVPTYVNQSDYMKRAEIYHRIYTVET